MVIEPINRTVKVEVIQIETLTSYYSAYQSVQEDKERGES